MEDNNKKMMKRLLNMTEFQEYSGIGRNRAFELVHRENLSIRIGRKILVDRVAFDDWVDRQILQARNNKLIV